MGFAAGRRWHHHVLLFVFIIRSSADSSNHLQAPGQLGLGTRAAFAKHLNSSRVSRRLFSLSLPTLNDVQSMVGKASKWVADSTLKTAQEVGKALGLTQLLQYLKEGREFIEQGSTVAHAAYEGIQELANELKHIYVGFEPLKPVFADKNGLMALLTSTSNMQILVKTIEELLKTSDALHYLGDVLLKATGMLAEITHFFHQLLDSHVAWRRLQYSELFHSNATHDRSIDGTRRLIDHKSLLLGGLNVSFGNIVHLIEDFVPAVSKLAETLSRLNATFAPVLAKLDSLLSVNNRRLNGLASIQQNQQIYAEAVKEIVPSWQGVESLGVSLCPVVFEAESSALALACRVKGFIDGFGALETVVPLVSECGHPSSSSEKDHAPGCPKVSLSSDIADLIGENSSALGWILAIVGSILGVGVVGVGGVVAKQGRGPQSDEDSDVDQLEELAPGDDSRG